MVVTLRLARRLGVFGSTRKMPEAMRTLPTSRRQRERELRHRLVKHVPWLVMIGIKYDCSYKCLAGKK